MSASHYIRSLATGNDISSSGNPVLAPLVTPVTPTETVVLDAVLENGRTILSQNTGEAFSVQMPLTPGFHFFVQFRQTDEPVRVLLPPGASATFQCGIASLDGLVGSSNAGDMPVDLESDVFTAAGRARIDVLAEGDVSITGVASATGAVSAYTP